MGDALAAPNTVFLNVFDLASSISGVNQVLCNSSMKLLGAFHAAVEVYGHEWSFYCNPDSPDSCGIWRSPYPRHHPYHIYRQSVRLGTTEFCELEVLNLIRYQLRPAWPAKRYDLVHCNCIHFCDNFLEQLGVERVPGWVSGLHDTGAAILRIWPFTRWSPVPNGEEEHGSASGSVAASPVDDTDCEVAPVGGGADGADGAHGASSSMFSAWRPSWLRTVSLNTMAAGEESTADAAKNDEINTVRAQAVSQANVVIGITGCSRSGKGWVSKGLLQRLEAAGRKAIIVGQDGFWFQACQVEVRGQSRTSEEEPECTDHEKFATCINEKSLTHDVVIAGGFQLVHDSRVVALLSHIFHIELDREEARRRRTQPRDATTNANPLQPCDFDDLLWPAHERYVKDKLLPLGTRVVQLRSPTNLAQRDDLVQRIILDARLTEAVIACARTETLVWDGETEATFRAAPESETTNPVESVERSGTFLGEAREPYEFVD